MMTTEQRFWSRAIQQTGCWGWRGYIEPRGYARFFFKDGQLAHRYSYALKHGPIPAGFEIDHLCKTRSCVNPEHLEAVPPKVNKERQDQNNGRARRTHCPQDHPYSGDNLYLRPKGGRGCKACRTAAVYARRASSNRV